MSVVYDVVFRCRFAVKFLLAKAHIVKRNLG